MSRSYKRTPRAGQQKDKFFKNYANRRLRRLPTDEHPYNNCSYKKYNCSWNICDYEEVGTSFEEYWERLVKSWQSWRHLYGYPFPCREQAYKEYCQWYKRK